MDSELLRLGRPPAYGGDEELWQEWSFQARAYLALVADTAAVCLDAAETSAIPLPLANFTEQVRRDSRKI